MILLTGYIKGGISTSKLNHYLFLLFNTSTTPKPATEAAINPLKNVPAVCTPVFTVLFFLGSFLETGSFLVCVAGLVVVVPVELSVSLIFGCIQRKISLQSGVDELLNNMENPDICRN